MNTPVSFETAKLLKEKGFDKIGACYTLSGGVFYTSSNLLNSSITGREKPEILSAPTIADVVMWFYEKHGIWIEVYYDNSRKEFYTVLNGEEYKFNSPTEAYQEAIKYCLTDLIKK